MSDIVFASSEASRIAHRELYHFEEQAYIIVTENLLETLAGFKGHLNRLHVSTSWVDTVRLATWKSEPEVGDILLLLRNMGLRSEELRPFRGAAVSDLFPWLYYGRKFDLLRKLCFTAKGNVERHIRNKEVIIHCHLTSEDTNRIVASSL